MIRGPRAIAGELRDRAPLAGLLPALERRRKNLGDLVDDSKIALASTTLAT